MWSKDIIRTQLLCSGAVLGEKNNFSQLSHHLLHYKNSSLACCRLRLQIIENNDLPTPFQSFQVTLFGCSQISTIFVCKWILNHLLLWRSVTLCFGGRMEYMKKNWRHLNISHYFLLKLIFFCYWFSESADKYLDRSRFLMTKYLSYPLLWSSKSLWFKKQNREIKGFAMHLLLDIKWLAILLIKVA